MHNLNRSSVTRKDVYTLPRVDDTVHRLRHAKSVASSDLKSSFWQIVIDEHDREKTVFTTPNGLLDFQVMRLDLE